jgi:predicted acylesterase/phospholipase RssA
MAVQNLAHHVVAPEREVRYAAPENIMATHPELEKERVQALASLPPDVEDLWRCYPGRIGVVLSGGGARGAYEAGVLRAFQDAKLPTHIITATSVGSINAASYVAHADPESFVGNAESLVDSWSAVTPPAVGIDWFRYILVLGGLTAMTAGFGNLLREWLSEKDVFVHLTNPKLTWFALGVTGAAFLYYHDAVSYLWHVSRNFLRSRQWQPDRKKVVNSLIGNVIVLGCLLLFADVAHLHLAAREAFYIDTPLELLTMAALVMLLVLGYFLRARISDFSHEFLRTPLRTGLFPNYERIRFLRDRLRAEQMRRSPIKVLMTAANVSEGTERCFTNLPLERLAAAPGVDPEFVRNEVASSDDLLLAVIASSAFPIVYETVPLQNAMWTDGGIVSNQPIRPAIRLGADALFLVMVEPRTQKRGEIKTFLDLGVRALDILMSQNLRTDLRILNNVNAQCSQFAQELGLRPEQISLTIGKRRYRYLKPFIVEPSEPVAAAVLDFDGHITAPAVVLGYKDGMRAVHGFMAYVRELPHDLSRREIKLVAEASAAARAH